MNRFFQNFQASLMRFMMGRNGTDALAQASLFVGIAFMFIDIFTGMGIFNLISIVFLAYSMFRCFSRNVSARYRENTRFLEATKKPRAAWKRFNARWDKRKTTKYLKCPQCGKSLSVPKGKGTLRVTCPSCKNSFTTKS